MKTILCVLLLLVNHALLTAQEVKNRYLIHGKLTGFADNTVFYLDDITTSSTVLLDSAKLINGQFHFAGVKPEAVSLLIIHTKRFDDYKYFWVENTPVEFAAHKSKFRDAVVRGSKTQNMAAALDNTIKKTGRDKEENIAFIRRHPNSMLSAYILSVYSNTWGKDTASLLYRQLSTQLKASYFGQNIQQFIDLNKNVQVGDRYADFTQPDTAGNNISLSAFKGKLTLLEFWGSWCGPCREGNPELVKIYNAFKDKGFEILGVATDNNKQEWLNAVRQDKLPWPNVCDLRGDKNRAVLIYGVSYFPSNFLISKDGIVLARDLRGEALQKKLAALLE